MHPTVLGEGGFGCVIQPSLPCDKKSSSKAMTFSSNETKYKDKAKATRSKRADNTVSKLFANKRDFMEEVVASRKVASIDPAGELMLLPTKGCKVSKNALKKNVAVRSCENIDRHVQNVYQLHMPYGGTRFDQYVKMMMMTKPMTPTELLRLMTPLFKALVLLEKRKMCHMDIKHGNVLIRPSDNHPIIIDYSLITPYKHIYSMDNIRTLRHAYFPYPPEFQIFYADAIQEQDAQERVIKNLKSWGQSRYRLYCKYISQKELGTTVSKVARSLGSLLSEKKKAWLDEYCNRIDIYSVGIMIVEVSEYLDYSLKDVSFSFKRFIKRLIHPDVTKRITPQQALDFVERIK